jgi:localization factor PodJL
MRLDDWLDDAIAEQAARQSGPPERNRQEDDWLEAVAGRLERILRRGAKEKDPGRPSVVQDSGESVVERFEMRLSRAEARAARAFESVAEILERADSGRDGDRLALVDAVRRLEAVRRGSIGADQSTRPSRMGPAPAEGPTTPKPGIYLKDAVSQIALRSPAIDVTRQEAKAAIAADAAVAPEKGAGVEAQPGAARFEPEAKPDSSPTPAIAQSFGDEFRTLSDKIDDLLTAKAAQSANPLDIEALRGEIAAMGRSVSDLAPRNAVVAIEGAIRDLRQRVETLRQGGCGELLLAPLDAMATELRATLKAHDPQAAAAALEREIRAIGAKIDVIAGSAIDPETFERIRRQTEEVRDLLASAALRTAPLERMERQIGEIADRVERLAASPTPHFESAEMAELLAEARRQIECSTPPAALQAIERRLEQIAERLDREFARQTDPVAVDQRPFEDLASRIDSIRESLEARSAPEIDTAPIESRLEQIGERLVGAIGKASSPVSLDPSPFKDLASRIDSVRQSLEARSSVPIDATHIESLLRDLDAKLDGVRDTDPHILEPMFTAIGDKLDRLSDPEAGARLVEPYFSELSARLDAVAPLDLREIEALLHGLEAKFEAGGAAAANRGIADQVIEEIARHLETLIARRPDEQTLREQIANIHQRIDALAGEIARTDDSGPMLRELLDRLRDIEAAPSAGAPEISAAIHAAFSAHLAELRAEQANVDRRTQTRLTALQDVLDTVVARLASIETELAGEIDEELQPPAKRETVRTPSALPGVEALGAEPEPQRSIGFGDATADDDSASESRSIGADFLLEPGIGAPQRAKDARDLAQAIGSKTNPAVSAHIAAARRAAHAALAESAGSIVGTSAVASAPDRSALAKRGVDHAKAFYAGHKRAVLLGVALVVVATAAVRLAGVRAPFLQRSELDGQAVKSAKVDTPVVGPMDIVGVIKSIGRAIDAAPTGSIASAPTKPDVTEPPAAGGPSPSELLPAVPSGISQMLRDAVAAGSPAAEYELALRLAEGRGLAKDQQAAAIWFERAASLGLAPAQYRLGVMYEKGLGVARDSAAAKRWYLKAAQAGNARAAHNLAVISAEPGGDNPDYVEAAKWFRRAGELGVRDSQYNLAILYARGLGVEQDLRQSWIWFSLAAQQGDLDAAKKRDEVAAKMDAASLAAAADALGKFKPMKPDPSANEVAPPPGGWDAKQGASTSSQASPAPGGDVRPQAPL